MKILHVNKFYYLKGGSEAYLFSLIDEQKKRGHKVAVFSMKHPNNRDCHWSKYFINNIDYETNIAKDKIHFAINIIYSFEAKKKITALIEKFKPHIVHLHIFQHQISPSILPEIKKRRIPIVYTMHDLKPVCPNYKMLTSGQICERCLGHRYYNCLFNKCTKNSYSKSLVNTIEAYFYHFKGYYDLIDKFITPSNFYYKKLIESGIPRHKIISIPNFINEKNYLPNYIQEDYFVYFGRLSHEKGILTLVDSMKWVNKGKLKIIGEGPLKTQIKKKIIQLGLSNVEVVGYKSGSDLKRLISNSMFSVLPSEWYENGPISLLETFALGKPIVCSNIGGIPEHVTPEEDGLVFEPKNSFDLAQKINRLLNEPEKLTEMGRKGRAKVERIYSIKNHIKEILSIYKKITL